MVITLNRVYCKLSIYHKTSYNKSGGGESKFPKEDEKILLLQSSCLANSSTFILAISSAKILATDWKSGTEIGFLSALSNMIFAFANNISIIIYLLFFEHQ